MSSQTQYEQEMLIKNTNAFYEAYDAYLDLKGEGFNITMHDALILRLITAIEDKGTDISTGVNDLWAAI